MASNLFPNFLTDDLQYAASENHWVELWLKVDRMDREIYKWSYPWLGTGSPTIKDGNPIFSAFSPVLRRGVRVVQLEPLGENLDIQAYRDFFGGDFNDPESICELVIACTLSLEGSKIALELMKPWVRGEDLEFVTDESGLSISITSVGSAKR